MHTLLARIDARPSRWLVVGATLLVFCQISHAIAPLAWIAPVPWLRFLRITSGVRSRGALAAALFVGFALAVLKIASEPHLVFLAPLFALPMALTHTLAYLAWDAFRRRASALWASAFFALALALAEVALYSLTEFGSWGAVGYTQLGSPLLQAASLVGLAGVGALVSFVGAAIESALAERSSGRCRPLGIAVALAALAHAFGAARLWSAELTPPPLLPVAMVATDADVSGPPLPDRTTSHAWDVALRSRTREAAESGAELVVWTEAAALVWPDEETEWVSALSDLARSSDVDVVAAYVVPVSESPFRYRNEYRLALRDGTIEAPYGKHHPVPGEPAIPGTSEAPLYTRPWGVLSGAICYDYDFPPMARARRSAGVVAVPASDWRGIDPVHGEMAAVRAIESGHSIVRSTRWGLSIAADAYGRVRAQRSSFEPGPPVTLALVPRTPITTLYAAAGDAPLLVAFVAVLLVSARRWSRA